MNANLVRLIEVYVRQHAVQTAYGTYRVVIESGRVNGILPDREGEACLLNLRKRYGPLVDPEVIAKLKAMTARYKQSAERMGEAQSVGGSVDDACGGVVAARINDDDTQAGNPGSHQRTKEASNYHMVEGTIDATRLLVDDVAGKLFSLPEPGAPRAWGIHIKGTRESQAKPPDGFTFIDLPGED